MLIAYLDESGAHGGPGDVFTLGGFVARAERWDRVERIWSKVLGHRTFHMVDFENRRGEFANWPSQKRRIPLVATLANSVSGNISFAVAHSVLFKDFEETFAPGLRHFTLLQNAYGFLLKSCLEDIVSFYQGRVPRGEVVSVVCEELAGVEGVAREMFDRYKRIQRLDGLLGGIMFLPKTAVRALQAADMLAYENFKHITNQVVREGARPARKLFSALQKSGRLSGGYYNRAALESVLARMQAAEARLAPPK